MKLSRLGLLAMAATLLLGAKPGPPPPLSEPVVIGGLFNLTGDRAPADQALLQGALLAVALANQAEGGIEGHRVQLVTADTMSDPETVVARTQELLALHPVALIGLSEPVDVEKSAALAAAAQVPFLTTASDARIPRQGLRQLFYSAAPPQAEAAGAAEFARERWKTAALAAPSTLGDLFAKAFQARGGEIVPLSSHPDVVFLDDPAGLGALRQGGYPGPVLGSPRFDTAPLGDDPGVYYVAQAFPENDPDFQRAYSRSYPLSHPNAQAVLGYDTMGLLLEALSRAHGLDAENARDALDSLGRWEGAAGNYAFASNGGAPRKTIFVVQNPRHLSERVFPDDLP